MKPLAQAYFEVTNNVNIKENEQIIIKHGNAVYWYSFAKNIPSADKQLLSELVLQSLNNFYIKLFYENINFDKSNYDKYLLFI